ncbi:hypothetical protein CYMTET_53345, partial [Cymbomonas tetramitiformis]
VYFYADPGSKTGHTLQHAGSDAATCFSAVSNYTSAADVDSTWIFTMTGVPDSGPEATLDWSLTGTDLVCNNVGCFFTFCGFAVDTYTLTGDISVFGASIQQASGVLYVLNAPPPTAATFTSHNEDFATNMTAHFNADLVNMTEIFYVAGSIVASITLQFAGTDYGAALAYYTSLSADTDLTLTLSDAFWDSFRPIELLSSSLAAVYPPRPHLHPLPPCPFSTTSTPYPRV